MSHRALQIAICCGMSIAAFAGCRQKMADQPRYEPLESSRFFADGTSARPPLAGTIARGQLPQSDSYKTGMALAAGGEMWKTPTLMRLSDYASEFPLPLSSDFVTRGQERFQIYCAPCHGQDGAGGGPVVKHGYPRPPNLRSSWLKNAPPGYLFDVVSRGYRIMPAFGSRISPHDRWAIVAYLRAMQQSGQPDLDAAELPTVVDQMPVAANAEQDATLRQQAAVSTDSGSGRTVRIDAANQGSPERGSD